MRSPFIHFFSLALLLVLLPLPAIPAAAPGDAADPALEAIKALDNPAAPAAAPEPQNAAAPAAGETPEAPVVAAPVAEAAAEVSSAPAAPGLEPSIAKDIVLVLDNSGSMKKNDPQFLANKAVTEFIDKLDNATHIAVIIFDTDVRFAMPLTEVNDNTREAILQSLKEINYKGMYTNSPAAMERAIYELKNSGRADSRKSIIFMTDGIVDTGNADRDQEKSRWLKEELAGSAADADIAIYGIAFTEEADYQLIQSLAQKTHGEYYRALKPEDLNGVYVNLHDQINKVVEPEPPPVSPPPEYTASPPPPPQPVIIEVPAQPQPDSKGDRLNSMLMIAALILVIAVILMALMVMRSQRGKAADEIIAPEAYLNDIHSYTAQTKHKLGNMPTMLGRSAGTDTDHLNYIVIPQTTIGRRHALIEYKDYAYWIVDQGSINGTYVNNEMITGETRLKHGDKVRLHKYEFEFEMPDMVEAGMTVVSHTVIGKTSPVHAVDRTVALAGAGAGAGADDLSDMSDMINPSEPDFDLSDMAPEKNPAADEEDTVLRGSASGDGDGETDADETIMLDNDGGEGLVTEATLRPDDNDDADRTVDHYQGNNKSG